MSPDRAPDECPERGAAAVARGRVALVLSLGIAVAISMATVALILAAYSGREIDTGLASVLSTALGASVGAIATYLGGQAGTADTKGAAGIPGLDRSKLDKLDRPREDSEDNGNDT